MENTSRALWVACFVALLVQLMFVNWVHATADDADVKEVGVEWVNNYADYRAAHPGEDWQDLNYAGQDAEGFYNELWALGWSQEFNWYETWAWEWDFEKSAVGGGDFYYIDAVDFAYFAGHGWYDQFIFNINMDGDGIFTWRVHSAFEDSEVQWGDQDLEWIVISACDVLNYYTAWVSPTGYSDPDGGWSYETNAYDDNEDTYAQTGILIRDAWSKFLYLTIPSAITCDKIRALNKYVPYYCYYDIDVYKDGSWVDVFDGYLTGGWDEISFTEGSVTQLRVRVKRVGGTAAYILRLYEADFGDLDFVQRRWGWPVFAGLHAILGFDTHMWDSTSRGVQGARFVKYMTGYYTQGTPQTIGDSWKYATMDCQPPDVWGARLGAGKKVGPSGYRIGWQDYLPDFGPVMEDLPDPEFIAYERWQC